MTFSENWAYNFGDCTVHINIYQRKTSGGLTWTWWSIFCRVALINIFGGPTGSFLDKPIQNLIFVDEILPKYHPAGFNGLGT